MSWLWVVGAGTEAVAVIKQAKSMGHHVIASDGNPQAPGFEFADERCPVDTYSTWQQVRCARAFIGHTPISGVIAACADVPLTVAAVAAEVGAHGLPLSVAQLGQDKWAMKQRLLAAGIPTARGWEVTSPKHITRLMQEHGIDLVVKPVDSRGARGVTRVRTQDQARAAFQIAQAQSKSLRVIAEEWLSGTQHSTESILLPAANGVESRSESWCGTPGFLDRNYSRLDEFAPYIIEDGADGPTRLSDKDRDAVVSLAEKAARAVVGDVTTTVKADMVLTPDGPKVIELALRLSGGYMSTELIPRMTGVDFIGAAIRLALGETVKPEDVKPKFERGVAIRYNIPKGCTSHPERKGHVIAYDDTRDAAIKRAERGVRGLA